MSECKKTVVVCHTGSDMTLEYAAENDIVLVSDIVIFGDEQYRTLRDIDSEIFFRRLETEKTVPTSSQPPIAAFIEGFEQAAAMGATEIVCVLCTAKMSGCFATADTARKLLQEQGFQIPIYVYDSEQSSHGLDFVAAQAARLAGRGLGAEQIIAELDLLRPNVGIYFIFDALKYLRRGGRVGAIRALAADTLGLRPILVFRDGLVKDVGISRRGYRDGMDFMVRHYEEEHAQGEEIIIFQSRMEQEAKLLTERIRAISPDIPIRMGGVGPVMGVYSGPKSIGIVFRKRAAE